jgi:hypothetical protein
VRVRAAERSISDADLTAVLHDPQITYTQTTYRPDRQVRQRGDLGLVVDLATHTVITVLFRDHERWLRHLTFDGLGKLHRLSHNLPGGSVLTLVEQHYRVRAESLQGALADAC